MTHFPTYRIVQTVAVVVILAVCMQTLLLSKLLAAPQGDQRATASVDGEVFMDSNLSGVREPSEVGIEGAKVLLSNANGEILAETVTDSEGYYSFANLAFDTYQLQIFPPAGYIVTSNGSLSIQVREVNPPVIFSTALRFGVLLPFVTR